MTVATGRDTQRLPGLDGLRALAIIAVVVYHLDPAWLPGGFLGVDLFFVISGFLITKLLLDRARAHGSVGIGAFYARRARRILPATVALIAVLVLLAAVTSGLVRVLPGDVLAGLGFATNWWQVAQGGDYFAAMAAPSSLQHLWSLAIEEQFYLVWPALVALAVAVTGRAWRRTYGLLAGVAIAGAVASGAWMAYLAVVADVPYEPGASRLYYGTDTHASGILVGAATAATFALTAREAARRPQWWKRVPVELAGLLALAGLGAVVLTLDEYDPRLYRGGFLVVAVLGVVAVACASRRWSLLGRLLDTQPLRWIGVVSFELYLWHWPVGVAFHGAVVAPGAVSTVVQVALMLALAALTHHWVTVPVWHPRPGTRTWPRAAVLGTVTAGVVAVAVAAPVALAGPVTPTLVAAPPAAVPPVSVPAIDPMSAPSDRDAYRLGEAALLGPISAFGDSVMLGGSGALRRAMPRISVSATVSASPGTIHDRVRTAKANGTLAPIVVIHSGANGVIRNNDLHRLVDELSDRKLVVLVTIKLPRTLQEMNNATIVDAARGHRNVVVADWAAASAGHPEWFASDGIHLRTEGAAAFAALIANAIANYSTAGSAYA